MLNRRDYQIVEIHLFNSKVKIKDLQITGDSVLTIKQNYFSQNHLVTIIIITTYKKFCQNKHLKALMYKHESNNDDHQTISKMF